MSTRRPVPPTGELPEPYPGDTEMLERARKDSLEQRAYIETSEARARKAHDEALEAHLRKIEAMKHEQKLAAIPEPLKDARHRAINYDALRIARALAGNLLTQAGLLVDALSDTTDAYALGDNTDIGQRIASISDNMSALEDLIGMTGRIKAAAIERGQA